MTLYKTRFWKDAFKLQFRIMTWSRMAAHIRQLTSTVEVCHQNIIGNLICMLNK